MGSLRFARTRDTAPPRAVSEDGIPADQRPVSPLDRSWGQRIAFTLSTVGVFPMTSHVECVAQLVKLAR